MAAAISANLSARFVLPSQPRTMWNVMNATPISASIGGSLTSDVVPPASDRALDAPPTSHSTYM